MTVSELVLSHMQLTDLRILKWSVMSADYHILVAYMQNIKEDAPFFLVDSNDENSEEGRSRNI